MVYLAMALHDRIRKLTYDDYALLPEDGRRHEIIDGELYVSPAPFDPSSGSVLRAPSRRFWSYPEASPARPGSRRSRRCSPVEARHGPAGPAVHLERTGRDRRRNKNVKGAPDLLIEILSKSTRRLDEEIKLHLYERHDVLEYWIFNTERQSVRAYRQSGERLILAAELFAKAGDVLTTPLLPALSSPCQRSSRSEVEGSDRRVQRNRESPDGTALFRRDRAGCRLRRDGRVLHAGRHPDRISEPARGGRGAARSGAAARGGGAREKGCQSQRYEIRTAIASGHTVALEVEWTATLKVPVGTLPAGGQMRAHFGVFLQFRDGRIAEQRNYDCFEPF